MSRIERIKLEVWFVGQVLWVVLKTTALAVYLLPIIFLTLIGALIRLCLSKRALARLDAWIARQPQE